MGTEKMESVAEGETGSMEQETRAEKMGRNPTTHRYNPLLSSRQPLQSVSAKTTTRNRFEGGFASVRGARSDQTNDSSVLIPTIVTS